MWLCWLLLFIGYFPLSAKVGLEERALRLFAQQRYAQAAETFEQLIFQSESHKASDRINWLKSLILAGQFNKAEKFLHIMFLEQRQKQGLYRGELWYLLARIFFLKSEYNKALREFASLILFQPQSVEAMNSYYWIAEILRRQGELSQAKKLFSLLLHRYPEHELKELAQRGLLLIETANIRQAALRKQNSS